MPSKQRSADRKWVRLNTSPVRLMAKQQQNTKCVGVIQAVLRSHRKKTGYPNIGAASSGKPLSASGSGFLVGTRLVEA